MDAERWLDKVMREGVCMTPRSRPALSARQVQEVFQGLWPHGDAARYAASGITAVRDKVAKLLTEDGKVISFGWNSVGMEISRGFRQLGIVLISHGMHHNDTIAVVEERFIIEKELKHER